MEYLFIFSCLNNRWLKCDSLLPIRYLGIGSTLTTDFGRIEAILMKLKRTTLVSHITNLMGLVVVLFLAVFSIWASMLIQQAVSAVKLSTSVSSTYQRILY